MPKAGQTIVAPNPDINLDNIERERGALAFRMHNLFNKIPDGPSGSAAEARWDEAIRAMYAFDDTIINRSVSSIADLQLKAVVISHAIREHDGITDADYIEDYIHRLLADVLTFPSTDATHAAH
jgi:hypothetical protein